MTMLQPTHRVTVKNPDTHSICSHLCFSLMHAELLIAAYRARGWGGEIEELAQ